MLALVHQQQQAAGSEAACDRLQRETACPAVSGTNVTDEQIDQLAASRELYGLTDDEI